MKTFDAYSEGYRQEVERAISFAGRSHDFFLRAKADRFLEELRVHDGSTGRLPRVLEVGCGVGGMHPLLQDLHRIYGVDQSLTSLYWANRRNASSLFIGAGGEELPFTKGSFDAVLVVCVLHHVESDRRASLVRELVRVLEPGGLLTLFEHNPYHPLTRLAVKRCRFDEGVVLLSARRAASLLRLAGLVGVTRCHLLFTPFGGRWFRRLDRWLAPLPLGAQYYVSGRKPS